VIESRHDFERNVAIAWLSLGTRAASRCCAAVAHVTVLKSIGNVSVLKHRSAAQRQRSPTLTEHHVPPHVEHRIRHSAMYGEATKETGMSYIEGFVAAVPRANKEAYRQHAADALGYFKKLGATRMVENWATMCRTARSPTSSAR
jgi:hypothetical protein